MKKKFQPDMKSQFRLVTIRAIDHTLSFAQNTHRIFIKDETQTEFIGWPDPTDSNCSPNWKPGESKPICYPKFAWEILN